MGLFGLTLSGGFIKLNLAFPPIIAAGGALLKWFVGAAISDTILAAMPVPIAKIPFFVAATMPVMIFVSGVVPIMGVTLYKSYDNSLPRKAKSAEGLKDLPTIFRFQSAHNNTIEYAGGLMIGLWIATSLGLEQVLYAKLCTHPHPPTRKKSHSASIQIRILRLRFTRASSPT